MSDDHVCEHVDFIEDPWWCPRCALFRICVGGLLFVIVATIVTDGQGDATMKIEGDVVKVEEAPGGFGADITVKCADKHGDRTGEVSFRVSKRQSMAWGLGRRVIVTISGK